MFYTVNKPEFKLKNSGFSNFVNQLLHLINPGLKIASSQNYINRFLSAVNHVKWVDDLFLDDTAVPSPLDQILLYLVL